MSDDWTQQRYAVVDVEGNGHRPPDLVELAVVPIDAGNVGEPVSWLVRPIEPITSFVRRIHGITDDLIAGAPRFEDVADEVRATLDDAAIVAHNAHVDLDVLRRKLPEWEPAEVFDTLKLARRLVPGQPAYRLGALVEAFKLAEQMPAGLQPHRATYDALVTARLFVHLATLPDGSPRSLAELRDVRPGGDHDQTPSLF